MASREWTSLRAELGRLALEAGGTNAFVFDAWGLVWCSARHVDDEETALLLPHVGLVLEGAPKRLQRGGRIDAAHRHGDRVLVCTSFAGVYVLAIWFEGPPANDLATRRCLKAALPRVEALTLALPPPDGPDGESGVAGKRA